MSIYKFSPNDIFYNRIKTFPEVSFYIYDRRVIYNNKGVSAGQFVTNVTQMYGYPYIDPFGFAVNPDKATGGFISLYELNVDRPSDSLIYPFITKDGSLTSFKTISTTAFNSDFAYGEEVSGTYPLIASMSSDRYATDGSRPRISALKTALNSYQNLSYAYAYNSDFGDKATQEMRLISIPSIFYGSSIKKGSVSLKFYITGTLIGELKDDKMNGELRQFATSSNGVTITQSGSIAGVVLYDEGFVILTGSWPLSSHTEEYLCPSMSPAPDASQPRWIDFAHTGSEPLAGGPSSACGTVNLPSSSFSMIFSGTNYVPTLTMLAHASKGELNHSNNPTYKQYNSIVSQTSSAGTTQFVESVRTSIANVASSSFVSSSADFQKITFIDQIGIYDDDKNLIAIAKLANPIRKREMDDYTFKLKLDF
jgi:hypothetical protein